MLMLDFKDIGWWYWLVTAFLLTAGLAGYSWGFTLAIGLTVVHLAHYIIRERSITAFSVQVRFWYLLLLVASYLDPLQLLFWVPTIGTWARELFGYCTMARCVSLLPWNRSEAFSLSLLKRAFLSRPVRGNIMQGL